MDLNELLTVYKNITLDMIEKVDNDLEISSLIKARESLLVSLAELEVDKLEIRNEIKALNINEAEEKLQEIVKKKMMAIKGDINKLKKSQAAYNQYVNFNGNAMIFSTTR